MINTFQLLSKAAPFFGGDALKLLRILSSSPASLLNSTATPLHLKRIRSNPIKKMKQVTQTIHILFGIIFLALSVTKVESRSCQAYPCPDGSMGVSYSECGGFCGQNQACC
ncbi:uncharacterized protein FA14DRAFT_84533 [Meira miltonrushii]|uniref:Uncharacterized protein n=1 Tax=Meira miltonrushii TaxID=1280837 RepID=A0A316V6F5_9BASI|nr:uncharacterized protein FA14DRAFT_84533 [Meira miltonrushii]PWN32061.1 hypothetical protein FA14DRAFT_84533 [Meira miltonrushii]